MTANPKDEEMVDAKLKSTGVPSEELLEKFKPPKENREQGPVVMIECFEKIPCDPCNKACKFGAVKPFDDINDLPQVDYDKCTGCGICIGHCPGLAIFVIDENYTEDSSLVMLPYEFLPLPKEGDIVKGLDREGNYVTDATVIKAKESNRKNSNYVVSLEVPKGDAFVVRNFETK